MENAHLKEESARWFPKPLSWKEEDRAKRREKELALDDEGRTLQKRREELLRKKKRLEAGKERLKVLETEAAALEEKLETSRAELEKARVSCELDRKELELKKSRLPYPEKRKAEAVYQALDPGKTDAQSWRQTAPKRLSIRFWRNGTGAPVPWKAKRRRRSA